MFTRKHRDSVLVVVRGKEGLEGGLEEEAKGEAFFNAPPFEHGGGIYSLITLAAHVRPGIVTNDVVEAFCSTAF